MEEENLPKRLIIPKPETQLDLTTTDAGASSNAFPVKRNCGQPAKSAIPMIQVG
jgi:hypothetical protein